MDDPPGTNTINWVTGKEKLINIQLYTWYYFIKGLEYSYKYNYILYNYMYLQNVIQFSIYLGEYQYECF